MNIVNNNNPNLITKLIKLPLSLLFRVFVTAEIIAPTNLPKDFNNFPVSLTKIVNIGIVALTISKIPENKDLIASKILLPEVPSPLNIPPKKLVNILINPTNKSFRVFNTSLPEIFFVIPSNILDKTPIVFCITTINPLDIFKIKLRIGVKILPNLLIFVSKKLTIFSIKPDSFIKLNNAPIKLIIDNIALAKVPDKDPANFPIEFKILKIIGKIADSILAAPFITSNNTLNADFNSLIIFSKMPPCLIESLNDFINVCMNSNILLNGFTSEIVLNILDIVLKISSKNSGKDISFIIPSKISCNLTTIFSIKEIDDETLFPKNANLSSI